MSAVVAVTVMHVLLFVLHVCVLWECARVTAMLVCGQGRCGCGECVYEWYTWFLGVDPVVLGCSSGCLDF